MPTGLEAALAPLAKEKGFLTLLYQDLAQPGVQQVGKALATVLGVGNTLLIPLRMLNEAGRAAEQASFKEIADRFAKIPAEDVVEVRPELGVPVIEGLSQTSDPDIRALFIELLASAASIKQVENAHPSFPGIISNLSPDEAKILRHLHATHERDFPLIEIRLKIDPEESEYKSYEDLLIDVPEDLLFPGNVPLYMSNMIGMGLFDVNRSAILADKDEEYEGIFMKMKVLLGLSDQFTYGDVTHVVIYEKHVLRLLPLGETFLRACVAR